VFPLLSEECRVPKGSDQGFLAKVTAAHARSRSFVKSRPDRCHLHQPPPPTTTHHPRPDERSVAVVTHHPHVCRASQHFKVAHYAEVVEYCVEAMTTKNNDHMAIDLTLLLQKRSAFPFLASLFAGTATGKDTAAKQRPTLADLFRVRTRARVWHPPARPSYPTGLLLSPS